MMRALVQRTAGRSLAIVISVLALGCATAPAPAPEVPANDLLNAVLWMQRSVEYKATALGAFTLARIRLDQALADPNWTAAPKEQTGAYQSLPPAIVLDADESILDNSAYQAWMALNAKTFDAKTWNAYVNTVSSLAIPGAVEHGLFIGIATTLLIAHPGDASHTDVLPGGEPVADEVLEEHGDLLTQLLLIDIGDVDAIPQHRACVRWIEATEELGERGLAGAVFTDQRHHLAVVELYGDALQRVWTARPLPTGASRTPTEKHHRRGKAHHLHLHRAPTEAPRLAVWLCWWRRRRVREVGVLHFDLVEALRCGSVRLCSLQRGQEGKERLQVLDEERGLVQLAASEDDPLELTAELERGHGRSPSRSQADVAGGDQPGEDPERDPAGQSVARGPQEGKPGTVTQVLPQAGDTVVAQPLVEAAKIAPQPECAHLFGHVAAGQKAQHIAALPVVGGHFEHEFVDRARDPRGGEPERQEPEQGDGEQ